MFIGIGNTIQRYKQEIFERFMDRHLLSFEKIQSDERTKIISQYSNTLDAISSEPYNETTILNEINTLIDLNIECQNPYIILINEIHYLQNIIIEIIIENNLQDDLKALLNIFAMINHTVAKKYLDDYISYLLSINKIRITGMSEIINKNIIMYYKAHLTWLDNLAICIKEHNKDNFPELDSCICDFGYWLNGSGKNIIQNQSKYKAIISLHNSLHTFGSKIYNQFESNDFHIFITYLEKCELLSLNIGTELALIDNILMNNQITKDSLTQALNRHALSQVFASQYEIALATSNSFIMAMCDLDYFKAINDKYGHLAGDKVLVEFVKIVKDTLRNSDIIIRYGGEEFIILLPAVKQDRGFKILNSIKDAFSQSILTFEEKRINATVSIGMLEIQPNCYYKDTLLEDYLDIVDKKLYHAKDNGRNQVYL